jgi:hypothetical protein
MDTNKLILHQATMAANIPGATRCVQSVISAIVSNLSIPFTRNDLHQLYDYDKALYKAAIEKNDNFSDGTKEKKKGEIEALFSEAEMLDMSLMPSDVYYPPTNLGSLATILNTITVQIFLKRLKEIMSD